MSFVSVVACQSFITVMSDGLVKDLETGKVLDTKYPKHKKISSKQFIAYSGIKEYCEHITDHFSFTDDMYNLSEIANQIFQIINVGDFSRHNLHFSVGGVDINGEIAFYTIKNKNGEGVRQYRPTNNALQCAFHESGQFKKKISLLDKLTEYLRKTEPIDSKKCLMAQKRLNDLVAMHDPTVNKKTFSIEINID
ncbi:hypothetical protein [Halalkalibacterium halodurans]|uniref:hypothetical protein n=1 Tax=Halalkalibacterium halodurans TaxID=86665 RepID=UPI002E2363E4|nr:hypothetical protein [Halalkalibacterium halodurans]